MCSTPATPDDITVTTFYKMAAGGHVEILPKKYRSFKRKTVKVVLNTSPAQETDPGDSERSMSLRLMCESQYYRPRYIDHGMKKLKLCLVFEVM